MKKESSSGGAKNGPTTKPSMQKIFGKNPLQLGGENDASSLIGGIVEKGFSLDPQSTPEPRSTVLPFPVARHRSHGPHWAPRAKNHDDVDDDGEDEDFGLYNPIGEFAIPIQRKQKKGLDLTRWRELVNRDDSSLSQKKERNKVTGVRPKKSSIVDNEKSIDIRMEDMVSEKSEILKNVNMVNNGVNGTLLSDYCFNLAYSSPAANCIQLDEMPEYGMEEVREEIMEEGDPTLQKVSRKKVQLEVQDSSTSRLASNLMSNQLRAEHGATSIENEIDAENRARLEEMSVDEILESQTELMTKLDPALIKMLKKRGLDKLKKKKGFSSEIGAGAQVGILQDEKESLDASTLSEGDISDKLAMPDSKYTRRGVGSKLMAKPSPSNGSLWEVWSKNVEAARDLRFSLDGNVIEIDSSQMPKTGNVSAQSSYNSDNVAERDFLRTEGNPGAVGYTIKEALALTRSVVPGQRSLALHLLASVLGKSMDKICQANIGSTLDKDNPENFIYWEAVWAFALGPEPELALSLRMCLDDNHNSVVLACAKVIQCVLSCDMNECLFDICEKTARYEKDTGTAPIFRSKPKIDVGFLQGGFWKYNSKPSNILPFGEGSTDGESEGEHTIQDDVFVAGQDFVAGLVRMGILPRIRYLLEADPSAALEECLLSILIAIARHSPTCADAVMKCQRLVHVVVNRFSIRYEINFDLSKIKSVTLIRVLALSEKKNCREFLENGVFHKITGHLYRYALSLDQWLNSGREKGKLSSALLVEQLRFWKVCIRNGYFVSNFADFFPALCNWLDVPTFEKLIEKNILCEFAAVSREAFLVLEALTRTLPNFYSHMHMNSQTSEGVTPDVETWCWSHVGPMVDLALKWIALERDPYLSKFFKMRKGNKNNSVVQDEALLSVLWVVSAVLKMLHGVLSNVIPEDKSSLPGGSVPWLPQFVPKIGLEIIKNGTLSFSGPIVIGYEEDASFGDSFLKFLCNLRHQSDNETSIASVCCIDGLVQVVVCISKLIQLANTEVHIQSSKGQSQPSREEKILADGIFEHALFEIRTLLTMFMKLIASEGRLVQSIEIFGRGGPAPGVGVGWGTSGGGFWSQNILLVQMDAQLLLHLLEIFLVESAKVASTNEEVRFAIQMVNCALDVCLVGGPRDRIIIDKMFAVLFQPHVLKCLDLCIGNFLQLHKGLKPFALQYKEENYLTFSNALVQHYKSRWLQIKKSKTGDSNRRAGKETFKKSKSSLDTIHEDSDSSDVTHQQCQSTSLVLEWAHQRLPLPMHWFLSPISILDLGKPTDLPSASGMPISSTDKSNIIDTARGGLFLLLGLEAMSTLLSSNIQSSIQCVPVVWKLHSLSVLLFSEMDILTDEKSRLVYENLQEFYGEFLDKSSLSENKEKHSVEFLKFQTEIHESYSTFTETLVEHFAGASYGDLLYGRQVAIYLHRSVEAPVRLAAWNALSNIRALELLPPLDKCVAKVKGYLEPVESDEKILEAYVKSWVSGALDRAVTRQSAAFTLVLHHLSLFIFGNHSNGELPLRNKLAKSLLRDYSRKPPHEGMMVSLIRYKSAASLELGNVEDLALQACEIATRLELLKEACERNSSLLSVVEKLRSALSRRQHYA